MADLQEVRNLGHCTRFRVLLLFTGGWGGWGIISVNGNSIHETTGCPVSTGKVHMMSEVGCFRDRSLVVRLIA